ncbi:MAG: hypothetical protein AAGN35_14780 [Bacteroidota bacterium]
MQSAELRWHTLDHTTVQDHPGLMQKIYAGEWDGFVFRSFFSPEECAQMQTGIAQAQTEAITDTPFGRVIGKKLDEADGNFQKLPLDHSFRYTKQFRAQLPEILGLDLERTLHAGILPLCSGIPPAVPVDSEGRTWNPATIRLTKPGQGGIPTHVGNEFNEKMPDIRHLGTIAKVHDQLSFFFLLQAPERGGELILYDAVWDETKDALARDYASAVRLVESRTAHVIEMRAGDLVIFAGGRVWHQVRDVQGKVDRITMGGFMAYSNKMDKLYHWS